MINVKVTKLDENAMMPERATGHSAGFDLQACLSFGNRKGTLYPGKRMLIPTGLAFEIPEGYEMQIRPRSGLAWNFGLTVLNSPVTIDSDYRKEVKIIVINHGSEPFTIVHGDRIAQAVFTKLPDVELTEVDEVDETGRGGFGSTGVKSRLLEEGKPLTWHDKVKFCTESAKYFEEYDFLDYSEIGDEELDKHVDWFEYLWDK